MTSPDLERFARSTFGAVLTSHDFRYMAGDKRTWRWWVRTLNPDIVQVVSLWGYHGGFTQVVVWGYHLPFVPRLAARGFAHPNLRKSFSFDLVVNPVWLQGRATEATSFLWQPERITSQAAFKPRAESLLRPALTLFHSVGSLEDLHKLYQRHCGSGQRSSFERFPQHYLAWAFVLLRLGRLKAAHQKLARLNKLTGIDPWSSRLFKKAYENAEAGLPNASLQPTRFARG